jgi:death on curing protein
MRYLLLEEIIALHERVITESGGIFGLRDRASLELAVAQPGMTFGDQDLYPTISEKAAALGHSLIQNHPFLDGNKRIGHAAMEVFLVLNGFEISASLEQQEETVLTVARGELSREDLGKWLRNNLTEARR